MRGQTAKRARKAKTLDTRVEKLTAKKVEGPAHERDGAVPVPRAAAQRQGRARRPNGLAKGYGGPPVFEDVSFDVGRGERLLIMGLNGAGKTSLLRILAGESEADARHVPARARRRRSATTRRSTRASATACRSSTHMRAESRGARTRRCGRCSACSACRARSRSRTPGTLSGGEKTKLALAQLVAGRKNLLLLDEPTNNLDPPSRTAIAEALAGWPGAMVLVSHDIEFVEALAPQRVLMMPDGTLDYWSDDLLELVALA